MDNNVEKLLFTTKLNTCYDNLSKTEKRIADYMRSNIDTVIHASAKELAEYTHTGPATIIRFCKSCGFSGLTELKISLKRESMVPSELANSDILPTDSVSVIKQKVLKNHTNAIESMYGDWNEDRLEAAVQALDRARYILLEGAGSSRTNAYLLHVALRLLNKPCFFYSDAIDRTYQLSQMDSRDVYVTFSYTGRYRTAILGLKQAKERGVFTIGILGIAGGPMEPYLDVVLYTNQLQREYYFGTHNDLICNFAIIEIISSALAARTKNVAEFQAGFDDMVQEYRT